MQNFECGKKFDKNSKRNHLLMNLKISRGILFRPRNIDSHRKDEFIQGRSPCINRAGQQGFSDEAYTVHRYRTKGLDI